MWSVKVLRESDYKNLFLYGLSDPVSAKRYERLLKANGIHPSGGTTEKLPVASHTVRQRSKNDITKAAAAKRRKIEGDSFNPRDDEDEDEDDYKSSLKLEPSEMAIVKPECDATSHTFTYSHIEGPPPSPFYHTVPVPRFIAPNPFAVPPQRALQHYQSSPSRQMQSSRLPLETRRPTDGNLSGANQYPMASPSHSNISVTEEQINSMFEEFCSQDLFKQSDFGVPVSPPTQESRGTGTQALPRSTELPSDPRFEPEHSDTKSYQGLMADANFLAGSGESLRSGDGVDDCILISD